MLCTLEYAGKQGYTTQSQKRQDEVDSGGWGTATTEESLYMQLHRLFLAGTKWHFSAGGVTDQPDVGHLSRPQRERSPFAEVTRHPA